MSGDQSGRRKVLDVAETKDRRALYAGLQAAMLVITNLALRADEVDRLPEMEGRVLRALDVGDTYGSTAHLASLERPDHG